MLSLDAGVSRASSAYWLHSGFGSRLQVHQFLASAQRFGFVQRRVGVRPIRRACGMASSIDAPKPALQLTSPGRVCISNHGLVHGNPAAELVR